MQMSKNVNNDVSKGPPIEAVFFKLGTISAYHKRSKMTPIVLLP